MNMLWIVIAVCVERYYHDNNDSRDAMKQVWSDNVSDNDS